MDGGEPPERALYVSYSNHNTQTNQSNVYEIQWDAYFFVFRLYASVKQICGCQHHIDPRNHLTSKI